MRPSTARMHTHPRVYALLQREFRRVRLPRATTPASLPAIVCKYAGDAACDEVAQTLPTVTGALHVRVFFCSGGRAVVAFVHDGHSGAPETQAPVDLEPACPDTNASALQAAATAAAGGSIAALEPACPDTNIYAVQTRAPQHQAQPPRAAAGGSIVGLMRACELAGPAAAAAFASMWHGFHAQYTMAQEHTPKRSDVHLCA